jgi:hypothetical protein
MPPLHRRINERSIRACPSSETEIHTYRIRVDLANNLYFENVSRYPRGCRMPMKSRHFDEDSPALMAQIREGYQEYLRGELRPIDEFMAELETELANE